VTTHFVVNPKIVTSEFPFRAVRQDAPPAGSKLREKMGKFVPQGALDLGGAVFTQSRIY
jgi:hypothetical protein